MSGPERFAYHRGVAPPRWGFVGLGSIELVVTHVLVVLLWSRTVALVLSAVTLAGLVWLVRAVASMKRLPVTLDGHALVMRAGTLKSVTVPVDRVAGLRPEWDGAALKQPGVLNLALVAYPNLLVDLDAPLPGRRGVWAIAHKLDDPAAFARAVERLVAER